MVLQCLPILLVLSSTLLIVSSRALYLRAAEDLRPNQGQWQAYESRGHCVVLAGPGSGKTKTLTIKLARLLSEEIESPRGIACITYNNECARELELRLAGLGVEPSKRVFVGTVHSFSLTQILLPYGPSLGLGLPDEFTVATQNQQKSAMENAYNEVISGSGNPQNARFGMDLYRRSILDRTKPEWYSRDQQKALLVEAYERHLRAAGLIDFDDMPLLALLALRKNPWLRKALVAKFPVLAVDEYQDLGKALHQMVLGLCFHSGMRLIAVGDADQSIYGFIGAHPLLLQKLSERIDVETFVLGLNYRCGSRIVQASEFALGEDRGYQVPENAAAGTVYFHPVNGGYGAQANYFFAAVLPEVQARNPGITLAQIGVLYPAAFMGDELVEAAESFGCGVVRTDANALYPRSSRLMRWLEQCAAWCCNGWQLGDPRWSRIVAEGRCLFSQSLQTEDQKADFSRSLMAFMWGQRDGQYDLYSWLFELRHDLLWPLMASEKALTDEKNVLDTFIGRIGKEGDLEAMQLGQFSGMGVGNDRLNLSTLHSSKGREFDVTILFGMDNGRLPRANASQSDIIASRRLFYVGFTRAKTELHMIYSGHNASPFVIEVENRLKV